jgi:hypothetical protein
MPRGARTLRLLVALRDTARFKLGLVMGDQEHEEYRR